MNINHPHTERMFTSVKRHKLQRAFAIAHRAGEDANIPQDCRDKFRLVAKLIWDAHGEPGQPPEGSGAKLLEQMGGVPE